MDKKYSFSQVSDEERDAFHKELDTLLEKYSLVAETVPVFERIGETGQFGARGTLFLQKKTEIVEAEVVKKEEGIPSTDPEVNPNLK